MVTLKAPGLCPQRRYFDTNPGAKSNVPLEPSSSNSTVCRYSALRRLMLEERGGRAPRERSSGRNAMLGVDRRGGNYRAGPAEFLRGICRESMTNVVLPGHQSTSRQPPRPRQKHCSGTQQRQRQCHRCSSSRRCKQQAASTRGDSNAAPQIPSCWYWRSTEPSCHTPTDILRTTIKGDEVACSTVNFTSTSKSIELRSVSR